MKTRIGFVSNSSSTSFIFRVKEENSICCPTCGSSTIIYELFKQYLCSLNCIRLLDKEYVEDEIEKFRSSIEFIKADTKIPLHYRRTQEEWDEHNRISIESAERSIEKLETLLNGDYFISSSDYDSNLLGFLNKMVEDGVIEVVWREI